MKEFIIIIILLCLWSMFNFCMRLAGRSLREKEPLVKFSVTIIMTLMGLFWGVIFLCVSLSVLTHYLNEINILLNVLPIQKL